MKIWFSFLLVLLLAASGCVSKSKARMQAQAAYMAGQAQAMAAANAAQTPTVVVVGDVRNHTLAWVEGLTLANAIVAAQYQGVGTPSDIAVFRNGQSVNIDPHKLLKGEDLPLEPNDRISIRP